MDFEKRLKEMSELKSNAPLFSKDELSAKLDMLENNPKTKINGSVKMTIGSGITIIAVLSYLLFTADDAIISKNNIQQNRTKAEVEAVSSVQKKNVIKKEASISSDQLQLKSDIKSKKEPDASDSTMISKVVLFDKGASELFSIDDKPFIVNEEVQKSEEEWKARLEGRVLSLPTISQKEAESLGIFFDGKYMNFTLEYYDRFYPISYKRSKHYKDDDKVRSFVDQGYPLDNSLFLYKKLIIADLGQSIEDIQENIENYEAKTRTDIFIKDKDILIPKGKRRRRSIYCDTLLKYDATKPEDYSILSPVYVFVQNKGELNNFQLSRINDRTALMENREDADIKNLNTFIPVKVNLPEGYSPSINSIVFWFVPSQELFSKLPKEIGKELQRQYNIYQMVENGKMSKSEACGEVNEKDYLGLCGLTNKEFSIIKLYPNPVKDILNLDVQILNKDKYDLDVFDQSGNQMNLKSIFFLKEGEQSIELNMSSLPAGMYFIRISNSENNYITTRIIKE